MLTLRKNFARHIRLIVSLFAVLNRPRLPQFAPQQLQDRRIRPPEIELADFFSSYAESSPQLIVRPQEIAQSFLGRL